VEFLLKRERKGTMGTLEMIGGIIIIFIVVYLVTGGSQKAFGWFREVTQGASKCEGMGFIGGSCVDQKYDYCKPAFEGLGCKGDTPICCFREEETPGTAGPVSVTKIELNPASTTKGKEIMIICDTNIKASGCVVVEVENNKINCRSEAWISYTPEGASSAQDQVQFACAVPSTAGTYTVKCRVDTTKCNVVEGQGEKTAQLTVS
jgi:hypothetical protein